MNILVCVKQVPDTTEIKIDPITNTLIRHNVPSIVNPFDLYALEIALRIKKFNEGQVTVLSMGPMQAESALRECLSLGADKAVLVSDKAFGGSDTLATSYILSRAIKKLGCFDIILCGKQAIDGDTAQVGPEIAEHLDIVQVTNVVDLEIKGDRILVKREIENGYEILETQNPSLFTIIKTKYEPRYPTLKGRMLANKANITILTIDDLDIDREAIGLKGSPTKVKKTFVPEIKKTGIKIELSSEEAVQKLINLMSEAKLI